MNQIAKLRKARGWSQDDLAERLGVTSVSAGRYEREDERLTLPLLRKIAELFETTVAHVIGETPGAGDENHLPVPAYDIRASAGHGAAAIEGAPIHFLLFREQWLRKLSAAPQALFVFEIYGDSMSTTLSSGDNALIDPSQTNLRHEGIYVIRIDDDLLVKRISMHPVTKRVTIKSDNPDYAAYQDIDPNEVNVVGRVVWIGRRLV